MAPGDLPPTAVTAALADAALIYFDGRLTETALVVAAAARAQVRWEKRCSEERHREIQPRPRAECVGEGGVNTEREHET